MPRRGKDASRPALTRERIVDAALALADAEGVDALSMRALARRLGVEAMSLYNHVKDKDDLLDAMVEAVIAGVERPRAGGDWREEMRRRAFSIRAALRARPWATPLVVGRLNVGPRMLDLVEATIACLVAAGFTHDEADHAWNAIDAHVYGFHLLEQNFPLAPEEYASAASAFLPNLPRETHPHMRALAEMVIAGTHSGLHDFGFGLDLVLDGLERRRGRLRST